MSEPLEFEIHIDPVRQGTYFTIPFTVPENVETMTVKYVYKRSADGEISLANGVFSSRPHVNTIDLGLIDPDGTQIGASGSDKTEFIISETVATPGYRPCQPKAGEWQIMVGAYHVEETGVNVRYEVIFTEKKLRLLRGDIHTHTLASDGVHTLEELATKARRNGLDFVAVTDHNQMVSVDALPRISGVTMIPGVEWTHYQGHANFLGLSQPYDQPFATNTVDEARSRFNSASQRGALIIINHPFEPGNEFRFDLNSFPFDCIEVWNGPMRESNLRAVGFWQQILIQGKKIPIVGGSDYHRDTPFIFLGGPTMGVYAASAGSSDILEAICCGHSFITFAPNGPMMELKAGGKMMGDSVRWQDQREVQILGEHLETGDVMRVVTSDKSDVIFTASTPGKVSLTYQMEHPGFARVEILRSFIPGVPILPALLTNPIYFDN